MDIVLGFGSTETAFEEQEERFVSDFVATEIKKTEYPYFTDEMVEELKKQLEARAEHYKTLDKEYKTATEFPDRYSYYYFDVVHNVNTLCVVFDFSHINRRHAMSPDGWGMMQNRKVIAFKATDY